MQLWAPHCRLLLSSSHRHYCPFPTRPCSRVATDGTTLVNAPAATQSSRHRMPLPYRPARSEPLNSQGSKVLYPGHPVKASLQVGGGAPLGEGMISVRARGAPSLPLRFSLGQVGHTHEWWPMCLVWCAGCEEVWPHHPLVMLSGGGHPMMPGAKGGRPNSPTYSIHRRIHFTTVNRAASSPSPPARNLQLAL